MECPTVACQKVNFVGSPGRLPAPGLVRPRETLRLPEVLRPGEACAGEDEVELDFEEEPIPRAAGLGPRSFVEAGEHSMPPPQDSNGPAFGASSSLAQEISENRELRIQNLARIRGYEDLAAKSGWREPFEIFE